MCKIFFLFFDQRTYNPPAIKSKNDHHTISSSNNTVTPSKSSIWSIEPRHLKIRQYDLMSTRTMRLILRTNNHYFHTRAHSTGHHQQHSKFEFEPDSTFHFEFDTTERVVFFQLEVKMDVWKPIGNAELNMMQGQFLIDG